MSKYVAKEMFYDTQDNRYLYEEGDSYPRDGYSPSDERIGSLLTGNNSKKKVFIETVVEVKEVEEVQIDQSLTDLSVDELKEKAKEAGLENYSKLKKAELIVLLSK